ncbi:MAG: DUF4157 domain-containing protein [Bacteroidota bacterium]|nr:DUF4157 domain-containing protein [Bacteroidota bacterium]
MKVRIKENSFLAKLAAFQMKADKVAIVFGHTIHLYHTSKEEFLNDSDWTCHELKHVEQYQQKGISGFLTRYIWDWVKNGYYNNKFEVEARASEKDTELMKKVQFI